ncbi:hypothetical protein IFM89_012950, partial [Coptis chinensis]
LRKKLVLIGSSNQIRSSCRWFKTRVRLETQNSRRSRLVHTLDFFFFFFKSINKEILLLNFITGSGDIDTSKVVKADANGCITGASGLVKLFCGIVVHCESFLST